MQKAVEDGCGRRHVFDELAPFLQRPVGGHQSGAHFVASRDDLEQVFAGLGRKLGDAHVVDDKEVALEVALHGALVLAVEAVVAEVGQDVEDRAIEHSFACFD